MNTQPMIPIKNTVFVILTPSGIVNLDYGIQVELAKRGEMPSIVGDALIDYIEGCEDVFSSFFTPNYKKLLKAIFKMSFGEPLLAFHLPKTLTRDEYKKAIEHMISRFTTNRSDSGLNEARILLRSGIIFSPLNLN